MKTKFALSLTMLLLALLACSLPGGAPPLADEPATPESATPEPTITPEPTAEDTSCLQGYWVLSTEDASEKLSTLTSQDFSVVDGQIYISFVGSDFAYGSDMLTVRFSPPSGGYAEVEGVFLATGRFRAEGGMLYFSELVSESEIFGFRFNLDGVMAEGPAGAAPEIRLEPPGVGAYECAGDTLSIRYDANGISITETYQRQR